METYRKSLNSVFLFRIRTATLMTALCVFMLAAGAANAVTYTDSSPQTTAGQDFIFTFSPVNPWNGGNGTFTVHARGDYSVSTSSEYLDWDIDGLVSDRAAPSVGGTVIQTFNGNDIEWEQSFMISGGLLNAITSDSSIAISIDLSSAVNFQIDPSTHFVEVELTYNASGPQCPPPPAPDNPDPCDGATEVLVDTCLSWNGGGGWYSEDFDDGLAQDWDESVDADWEVVSGEYRAYRPSPIRSEDMFATYAGQTFDNFTYEMKVRQAGSTGSARYMLFRTTPDFDYYPTRVGSTYWFGLYQGDYAVIKQVSGVTTTLVSWTVSSHINSADEWNTLKVVADGPDLHFYINDNLVNTVTDTSLTAGRIGILGFTGPWYIRTYFFDDVVIGPPEPISSPISTEQQWYNEHTSPPAPQIDIDLDGASEPESPMPSSTTVPSGFLIRNGILVEEQSQDELSSVVVEDLVSFTSTAGATLISFDDGSAPCGFRDTVRLTGKYAVLGVIFEGPGGNDGGAILNECSNFGVSGHSSPNFLGFNSDATLSDGGRPICPETMHFNPPVTQVQALLGSQSGAGNTVTMEAYNNIGVLVDSATITLSPAMIPISVSGIGITAVAVSTSTRAFVLDDLQFSPGNVCPTTWDVYFGKDSSVLELVASNLTDPNYCPGGLETGETYFWQVIAKNSSGETPGNVWSFETEGGDPPDCNSAVPSVAEIWSPRHEWVDIEILDVNDPDGDPVSITITGITQDEPVAGHGSGKTSPDGMGVGTSVAHVRAERSGQSSNGRVYEISFEADDGTGNTCNGSVKVCVPHDQGQGHECVDDGQLYDSTATEMFSADLNGDGIIDLLDFNILAKYWLVSYELED